MPNGKDQIVLELLDVKKWNQNVSLLLVAAKASLKPITNASKSTETSGTSKLKKLEQKLERDGIAQLYFLLTWHNLTHKDEDAAHDIIYKEYNKLRNIYYMFILRGTTSKSYLRYKELWAQQNCNQKCHHEMHLKRFMKIISAEQKLIENQMNETEESSTDDDVNIFERKLDNDDESSSDDDAPIFVRKQVSSSDDDESSGYSAESSRYTESDYDSTSYDNDSDDSDASDASD
eukprot:324801_1